MNLDKHATIARLRSTIRSQESASRGMRQEINALRVEGPSSGQARCNLNVRRKAIGCETRVLLLALAMVRGRPYASQESTAREAVPAMDVTRASLGLPLGYGSISNDALTACMAEINGVAAWAKGGPSPVTYAAPVAVAA
jgi:hypothetical protein